MRNLRNPDAEPAFGFELYTHAENLGDLCVKLLPKMFVASRMSINALLDFDIICFSHHVDTVCTELITRDREYRCLSNRKRSLFIVSHQ
eukprot:m.147002 g.147002  ORF g.147002 m.147002 type:complete len:89 (+) comp14170_c0_seq3:963-1229(+)